MSYTAGHLSSHDYLAWMYGLDTGLWYAGCSLSLVAQSGKFENPSFMKPGNPLETYKPWKLLRGKAGQQHSLMSRWGVFRKRIWTALWNEKRSSLWKQTGQ